MSENQLSLSNYLSIIKTKVEKTVKAKVNLRYIF